jgi:hypothetical protein
MRAWFWCHRPGDLGYRQRWYLPLMGLSGIPGELTVDDLYLQWAPGALGKRWDVAAISIPLETIVSVKFTRMGTDRRVMVSTTDPSHGEILGLPWHAENDLVAPLTQRGFVEQRNPLDPSEFAVTRPDTRMDWEWPGGPPVTKA